MLQSLDDLISEIEIDVILFHPPRLSNLGSNSIRRSIIVRHLPRVVVELSMEDIPRTWRAQCVVIGRTPAWADRGRRR